MKMKRWLTGDKMTGGLNEPVVSSEQDQWNRFDMLKIAFPSSSFLPSPPNHYRYPGPHEINENFTIFFNGVRICIWVQMRLYMKLLKRMDSCHTDSSLGLNPVIILIDFNLFPKCISNKILILEASFHFSVSKLDSIHYILLGKLLLHHTGQEELAWCSKVYCRWS